MEPMTTSEIIKKAKWFESLTTKEQSDYLEEEYKKLEVINHNEILREDIEDILFDVEIEIDTCNIPSLSKKHIMDRVIELVERRLR